MPKINIDDYKNPLLTNFAQGYSPPNFVNRMVCPPIPVTKNYGSYRVMKDGSYLADDTRARNTKSKTIDFAYGFAKFQIEEKSLASSIDLEDIKDAKDLEATIDLKIDAVKAVDRILETNRENRVSEFMMSEESYDDAMQLDLTEGAGVPWSDTEHADPMADVAAAREAVRAKTGLLPNSLVMGYRAYSALRANKLMKASLSITEARGLLTLEQIKFLLEVDNLIVGNSVYNTAELGADPIYADFWGEGCSVCNIPSASEIKSGMPVLAAVFENLSRSVVLEIPNGELIDFVLKRYYDVVKINGYNAYLLKNCLGS